MNYLYIKCLFSQIISFSEKKPVKFPQKPSFNDILVLLERRALEKRRDKRQQTAGIQSRSFTQFQEDEESEELRDIEIEAFF